MKDLNKEIEEMASKLEKASQDPKEKLFSVIKALGSEGLKARLPELSDEDKTILKAALEEMNSLKKAIEFDKEAQGAKMINGKITDTIIQEEIASDDADEKLVKPAAAKHSHQGTATDGWQGQVIKSLEESEDAMGEFIGKMLDRAEESVVVAKCEGMGMDKMKVQGAIDKYKKKKGDKKEDIEKGKMKEMSMGEAKDKIMDMEQKEHGTKDPKKLVEAEKKEHKEEKMKKSEEETSEIEKGNKNMTKSLTWEDDSRLLKANTLGRNFHFNVEHFVTETLKQEPVEQVQKSEKSEEDLNDLIEKSLDQSWDQVNHARRIAAQKQSGNLVKSFDEVTDLAASLGISEEDAKEILGIK